MPRRLVVERKRIARVADLVHAAGVNVPTLPNLMRAMGRRNRRMRSRLISRLKRVAGKGMQNVCQHQFLMLLLMIDAEGRE